MCAVAVQAALGHPEESAGSAYRLVHELEPPLNAGRSRYRGRARTCLARPHGDSHRESELPQAYNGVPASEVRSATGARRLGIEKVGGVVCRGVLLDLLGESARLEAGRALTASDLQRALREVGTEPHPGDAALIRTGWLARFDERDLTWYEVSRGSISTRPAGWPTRGSCS